MKNTKSLKLLGVPDEQDPGKFRAINESDFDKNIITLVFMDMENAKFGIGFDFHVQGNLALRGLIPALKRHVLEGQEALQATSDKGQKKKDLKVTFEEKTKAIQSSFKIQTKKFLSNGTIIIAGHHGKESVRILNQNRTIELTDEYKAVINNLKDIVDSFAQVEEMHFDNPAFFEEKDEPYIERFLFQVVALAPNLKRIVVPNGVDPSLCVNYWSSLWHKKLEVLKKPAEPDKLNINDDETRSTSTDSPIQLAAREQNEEPEQNNPNDGLEEQVWDDVVNPYGNLTKAMVCAVTVTAVAYRASKFEMTPTNVFWAASQADNLVRQVMRTASRVPFLPSAVRLAGSIANTTIGPVARNVAKLFG